MNGISLFVAITTMLFFSGCGFFGPPREEVTQQPNQTVFRSTETPDDDAELTPTPQRVPGEKKSKSP